VPNRLVCFTFLQEKLINSVHYNCCEILGWLWAISQLKSLKNNTNKVINSFSREHCKKFQAHCWK
jgi:hypothetical protein